jgi:hypothetical protein
LEQRVHWQAVWRRELKIHWGWKSERGEGKGLGIGFELNRKPEVVWFELRLTNEKAESKTIDEREAPQWSERVEWRTGQGDWLKGQQRSTNKTKSAESNECWRMQLNPELKRFSNTGSAFRFEVNKKAKVRHAFKRPFNKASIDRTRMICSGCGVTLIFEVFDKMDDSGREANDYEDTGPSSTFWVRKNLPLIQFTAEEEEIGK